jgi:competence ComEA-like helix-hairpin-helix protein
MASFSIRLFILLGVLGFSFWLRFIKEDLPRPVASTPITTALRPSDVPRPPVGPVGMEVNVATREALMSLPGIGPKRADAIIAERVRNGAFHSVEDVLRVPGIGPATLKSIAPNLHFSLTTDTPHEQPK